MSNKKRRLPWIVGAAVAGLIGGLSYFYFAIYAPAERRKTSQALSLTSEITQTKAACSSTSRLARANSVMNQLEALETSRRNLFIANGMPSLYKPAGTPSLEQLAETAQVCNARIKPRLVELEEDLKRLSSE